MILAGVGAAKTRRKTQREAFRLFGVRLQKCTQ